MSVSVTIPGKEVMGPVFRVKVNETMYEYEAGATGVTVPDEVGAAIANFNANQPKVPESKRQEYWVTFHMTEDQSKYLSNDGTKTLWYVEPNS